MNLGFLRGSGRRGFVWDSPGAPGGGASARTSAEAPEGGRRAGGAGRRGGARGGGGGGGAMIQSFMVINNLGKVRLARFYGGQSRACQQEQVREAFLRVNARPAGACNFVDAEDAFGPGTRLVYRQFATLFFVVVCDTAESDLGMLDLIQVYVEALDNVFENVCELNLIFSQPKAMQLLDEVVTGGLVLDTNGADVLSRFWEVDKAHRAPDPAKGSKGGGVLLGAGKR